MGIKERKARQKAELRKKILKSARTIARKHGWEAVTTRKLAEKVEYSTTVIYEHFGNKDQLLLLLREEVGTCCLMVERSHFVVVFSGWVQQQQHLHPDFHM